MEFKQYPSYKNSGVEWLGDVPEHWQQKPIWSLFKRIKRTNFPTERLLSVYRDYGVIPKDSRDDNHNRASEDLTPYQLVCANDLVINKMKAWQGSIAISELRGIVSPAYYIYQPKAEYHSKYIHFLIRSAYYIQSYKNYSKGIRVNQWDLESEAFTHIDLLLPSLDEQQKIVAFLDTETTRIDNLIAKQEKLIELLEEQRKSIISHAVTKGLNPNAPMKDSGVEWLGEVPEDWEVKRFGYIFTENKKKNIGLIETNVLSLSYGNIKEKNIDDNKGLLPESFETYQIIEPNDIVFRFTDLQNDKRSLRNAISKYHGIITSAYIGVKTKENADFYNYLFRAYDLQKVFYSMGDGMRQSLKMDELNKMPIVLPKIEAQERIVKFINEENQRINNLVVKQKNLIEKLKEYRASIISHAVTGKIDVREFGA